MLKNKNTKGLHESRLVEIGPGLFNRKGKINFFNSKQQIVFGKNIA